VRVAFDGSAKSLGSCYINLFYRDLQSKPVFLIHKGLTSIVFSYTSDAPASSWRSWFQPFMLHRGSTRFLCRRYFFGGNSVPEVLEAMHNTTSLLKLGNFLIWKWCTNSCDVLRHIPFGLERLDSSVAMLRACTDYTKEEISGCDLVHALLQKLDKATQAKW